MKGRRVLTFVCTIALPIFVFAGPLEPPAGPVTSTMKTLDTVEPRIPIGPVTTRGDATTLYRITQPGSYYLTENLVGQAGKAGITVAASGVTIDLNGFTVSGPGSNAIIPASFDLEGIAVRNGTVTGWTNGGVFLSWVTGARVENVTAIQSNNGISVGPTGTIRSCVALQNAGNGIQAESKANISDCTSRENGAAGFFVGTGGLITDSTASDNTGAGIRTLGEAMAKNCVSNSNGTHGVQLSDNGHVLDCMALGNGQHGIYGGWAASIDRCTVSTNGSDGINVSSYSKVSNCMCRSNGNVSGSGAGIRVRVSSVHAVVRDNNCCDNDWGVRIDGTLNLVVGNTCTSNSTNFDILSGNRVAQIVSFPLSGAISGDSGGTITTTQSNCNFAY